jgi:hypothetical protein
MKAQQHNSAQVPQLGIADKCNITINGDRLDDLVIEIDALSDSVSRIVGAKAGESSIPMTSADELARLLSDIREDLPKTPANQKAINTLDAAIELAFLHSPVYKEAFEIYRLDLTGRIIGGDAAYDLIHAALLSALGKKADTEESE